MAVTIPLSPWGEPQAWRSHSGGSAAGAEGEGPHKPRRNAAAPSPKPSPARGEEVSVLEAVLPVPREEPAVRTV